jgi:hypothetical protein
MGPTGRPGPGDAENPTDAAEAAGDAAQGPGDAAEAAGDAAEAADAGPVDPVARARSARVSRQVNAGFVRWLLAAVAALAMLGLVMGVVGTITATGVEVVVIPAQDAAVADLLDPDLPDGSTLVFERPFGPLRLQVEDVDLWLRALGAAGGLVGLLLVAVGAWSLGLITADISAGRPFAPRVSRHLGVLAGLALVGAFVPASLDNLASTVVLESTGVTAATDLFGMLVLDVDLGPVLLAVVIGVLDQAVRHGRRLAAEVEGLG